MAGIGAFLPRVALVFLWIFTPLVERAFTGWVAPLAGLILLPYTTLVYVVVYAPEMGVTGIGWVFVVIAFLFDLGNYGGGVAGRGRRVDEFYSRR